MLLQQKSYIIKLFLAIEVDSTYITCFKIMPKFGEKSFLLYQLNNNISYLIILSNTKKY